MSMKKINYVGQIYKANDEKYGEYIVIKDLGLHKLYDNINQRYRLVEIMWRNTGNRQIVRTSQLGTGSLKDKFARTVVGVGYIGNAVGYSKKEYDIWYHMLKRCYDQSDKYYHVYGGAGVTVDPEWHNLENFLNDIKKLHGYNKLMAGEKMQLDKDLLQIGVPANRKVYSKNTCCFVSNNVNNAEKYTRNIHKKEVRYNGVYSNGSNGYIARIFIGDRNHNLGTFDSAEHAAAYRDYIASLYGRRELLNHTGIPVSEAMKHRKTRYNSMDDVLASMPKRRMCTIIDNNLGRIMCRIVDHVDRG